MRRGGASGGGDPLDEDLIARVGQGAPWAVRTWVPDRVAVVLGRANVAEREAFVARCRRDRVPVLRRRGGGGAVVLAPGAVVVSLAWRAGGALAVDRHRTAAVSLLVEVLVTETGLPIVPRGWGDLCVGDRKVLGSSVYRRRGIFFFQASLLVAPELVLLDRYLRHPSREPEYRRRRAHRDFVTTLRAEGCGLSAGEVAARLQAALARGLEAEPR